MAEKNNIETAHQDLIQDYHQLKSKNDQYAMENRTLRLEVEELNNRIEHLKKTILRQYERAQEDDEVGEGLRDGALGSRSSRPPPELYELRGDA